MSFTELPLELVAQIIEYLSDDLGSLKVTSLVSRPCLASSRTHLFKTLRMNTLNPSFNYKCTSWESLLQRSTAVLPYIRELELGPPVFRLRARDLAMCSKHWRRVLEAGIPSIHNQCVERILEGAVNVTKITLRFEFQLWKNFSPSFQNAVLGALRWESVSSISIEDVIGFPVHPLSQSGRLRELSLFSVGPYDPKHDSKDPELPPSLEWGKPPVSTSNARGRLHSLTLFESDCCVNPFVLSLSGSKSLLNLSSLQRLSVNVTGSDGQFGLNEFSRFATEITILELRISSQKGYDSSTITAFPNLRTLLISTPYDRHQRPIQILAQFFSQAKKCDTLEELFILFRFETADQRSSHELEHVCANKDWLLVDQALTFHGSLTKFPLLRKLKVIFRPKDVATFMSDYLALSLNLFFLRSLPSLYALTSPKIDIYDDRFEQYVQD